MIQNSKSDTPVSDEELLARAIPIDAIELEGEDDVEPREDMLAMPQDGQPAPIPSSSPAPAAPSEAATSLTAERGGQHAGLSAGATRVKSFSTKLKMDLDDPVHGPPHCISELDSQVNTWLKAHPGATVKFATTAIGEMMSKKGAESVLVLNMWV